MNDIVILGIARTAIGSFLGPLSSLTASQLGSFAIQGALKDSGIDPSFIDDVYMGQVLTGGCGQAPARQAARAAHIEDKASCVTVNKVCGSGMFSIIEATRSLRSQDSSYVVCGGMESMSQVPFFAKGVRQGWSLGSPQMIDGLVHDGLWDPYYQKHMGSCAELCAREFRISRQEQDEYAVRSYERALEAIKKGDFQREIVPVEIVQKQGNSIFSIDDEPSKVKFDKIPHLKSVFEKEGTITAANASSLNDGAAALVVTTGQKARETGHKPLAKIVSYAFHAQDPQWFTTAPSFAIEKALKKAHWSLNEVDIFEINEAFSVVALAAHKQLHIPLDRMNIRGGAVSLGHPIGASGARIVVTLISILQSLGKKKGCASICIGGGEAIALCVEMC